MGLNPRLFGDKTFDSSPPKLEKNQKIERAQYRIEGGPIRVGFS